MTDQNESVHDMLTTSEAAKLLRVSEITMYRWRKIGKLPFTEYPRQNYRYRKSDIDRLLHEGVAK